MSGQRPGRPGPPDRPGPWAGAGPELAIAAITVLAAGTAATVLAGWPGLVLTALILAVLAIVVIRFLTPARILDGIRTGHARRSAGTLRGYSQRRYLVSTSLKDAACYQAELRPVLEHLLAARLAERHGINLYTEPDRARDRFCRRPRDQALWRLIAPDTSTPETGGTKPGGSLTRSPGRGIPAWTLARLIDRLEKL